MPCFRGIEVFVVTQSEVQKLPEFPHPDGSSVRLLGPAETASSPRPTGSSIDSGSDSIRLQKSNPKISVYIPSLPGAQFWLQYAVDRPPEPPNHLFFKMFMNGRHITSWGINPKVKDSGCVVRALYEPGDRWHYDDNGVTLKRDGIEMRYFHFTPGPEKVSVAEDGGLIEVQVFRAKGKRRRAAKLEEYRSQENYGIASPSGGLLENPEDATYFDWLLIDAKNSPYATFRFHYRSWTNLKQLNIVSVSDPRNNKPTSTHSCQRKGQDKTRASPKSQGHKPFEGVTSINALDGSIFEDNTSDPLSIPDTTSEKRSPGHYFLKSPPELLKAASLTQRVPQPSKLLRDGLCESYLQRPLPVLPETETHSRKSSSESHAPSITASLLPYVDDEYTSNEEVEFGVARTVAVPAEIAKHKTASCRPLPYPPEPTSPSDYDTSPPSSEPSRSPTKIPPPQEYLATSGSMIDKLLSEFPSPDHIAFNIPATQDVHASHPPKIGNVTLSEGQWMKRSPSPLRRKGAQTGMNELRNKLSKEKLLDTSSDSSTGVGDLDLGENAEKLSRLADTRRSRSPTRRGRTRNDQE